MLVNATEPIHPAPNIFVDLGEKDKSLPEFYIWGTCSIAMILQLQAIGCWQAHGFDIKHYKTCHSVLHQFQMCGQPNSLKSCHTHVFLGLGRPWAQIQWEILFDVSDFEVRFVIWPVMENADIVGHFKKLKEDSEAGRCDDKNRC